MLLNKLEQQPSQTSSITSRVSTGLGKCQLAARIQYVVRHQSQQPESVRIELTLGQGGLRRTTEKPVAPS
jgi:hypothetical protein